MTVDIKRSDLPRFQNEGFKTARITSVAREKIEGKLPPLIDDARDNYLARIAREEGNIYVKAVLSPWTGEHGIHFLIIPDRKDRLNIPGIADLSSAALGCSIKLAESLAFHTLQQDGIDEVDFGVNHSRELKRTIKSPVASVPQNLHIHITGYSAEDMKPVSIQDLTMSSELTGRTEEALYAFGEGLLFGEIVPVLKEMFPAFDAIFKEAKDQRGRRRFQMIGGRSGFSHPDLPNILQTMDALAKQKYDEVLECFVEKGDNSVQSKLLPKTRRRQNINAYINNHQDLARGIKLGLRLLAAVIKDEQAVAKRELILAEQKKGSTLTAAESEIQLRNIANRFWAYKDLAYTLVWSAQKNEKGDIIWIFGFDPKVFTIHGVHQSAAFTNKIVERDLSGYFTEEQFRRAQEREARVLNDVKEEMEELELKIN